MKTKRSEEVIGIGAITGKVIATLLCIDGPYKTATKFLDPKFVVKATHQRKPDGRDRSTTLVVTLGRPNYTERKFIKDCKKAGVPFPVRKVQLKFWPKKRK